MTEAEQNAAAKILAALPREKIDPPLKIMHGGQAFLGVALITATNGTIVEAIDEAGKTAYLCGDCAAEMTTAVN